MEKLQIQSLFSESKHFAFKKDEHKKCLPLAIVTHLYCNEKKQRPIFDTQEEPQQVSSPKK